MTSDSEFDQRTNLGAAAGFLECLNFDVEHGDSGVEAYRSPPSGGSVRYKIRYENEDSIRTGTGGKYFSFFEGDDSADVRNWIIVSSAVDQAESELKQRLDEAEERGISPLELERTKLSKKSHELRADAEKRSIHWGTLSDFLRSFVNMDRLRTETLEAFDAYRESQYVIPRLESRGREMRVRDFEQEVLLRRPPLIVLHAPGGRGKSALSEFVTKDFLEGLRDLDGPVPFLVKLEKHRRVRDLSALLEQTLNDYGLGLDLGSDAVEFLVKHGVFVLILDGFDELAEQAGERARANIISQISDLIRSDTDGRALLTARSTFLTLHPEVLDELEDRAELRRVLVELRRFNRPHIRDFLLRNAPAEVDPERHRDRVETFIHDHKDEIRELAQEPLTLGMLSEVIGSDQFKLPSSLTDLYQDFIANVCIRETERHDLPAELDQWGFLETISQYMLEFGGNALEEEWVRGVAEETVDELTGTSDDPRIPERRDELVSFLADHYMFQPSSTDESAEIVFRHTSFRDFLIARSLVRKCRNDHEGFLDQLGRAQLPDEVLAFVSNLFIPDDARTLQQLVSSARGNEFRNLIRLAMRWDGGNRFKEIFNPPHALTGKKLQGLVFDELDLQGYRWVGSDVDGAVFRGCDCRNCDFGAANWNTIRFDGCTLKGADIGESIDGQTVVVDGEPLGGEELQKTLSEHGALGPGVREVVKSTEDSPPLSEMLEEVFSKVVIVRHGYEDTVFKNAKPGTFERGQYLAENNVFIRNSVLPTLRNHRFLEESGDSYGTYMLIPDRRREVQEFLIEGERSPAISQVLRELKDEWS